MQAPRAVTSVPAMDRIMWIGALPGHRSATGTLYLPADTRSSAV